MAGSKRNVGREREDRGLRAIVESLSGAVKRQDSPALLEALQRAHDVLEGAQQQDTGMKHATSALAKAVVDLGLLQTQDRLPRAYLASCLAYVLKVHAPESPFSDSQLRDVFALILRSLQTDLQDRAGRAFPVALGCLTTLAQVKCCLLLLDLESDELLVDYVRELTRVVNEHNSGHLPATVVAVLVPLIEESEGLSQELTEALLGPLVPPLATRESAAVVKDVLYGVANPDAHASLLHYVMEALQGTAGPGELSNQAHALAAHLYRAAPQSMLPALAALASEAVAEDEGRRAQAVDALGGVLMDPTCRASSDAPHVLAALLGRAVDASVGVRERVVRWCGRGLRDLPDGPAHASVAEAVRTRLLDQEDSVRLAAVQAALAAAAARPGLLASQGALLEALLDRTRDKRPAVRAEACRGLAAAFQGAVRAAEPGPADALGPLARVPARLVACAALDPELRGHPSLEPLLTGEALLPPDLPVSEAAAVWVEAHRAAEERDRTALQHVLQVKGTVRREVTALMDLRRQFKEARKGQGLGSMGSQDLDRRQRVRELLDGLQQRVRSLARLTFHDVPKAEQALQRLVDHRDNSLFAALRRLCRAAATVEDARAAAAEVQQRFGGARSAGADAVRSLCAYLLPGPVSPAAVAALAGVASAAGAARDVADALGLLRALSQAAPDLVAPHAPQLCAAAAAPGVSDVAREHTLRLLSALASRSRAVARCLSGEEASPGGSQAHDPASLRAGLAELCWSGAPKVAKFAARALGLTASTAAESQAALEAAAATVAREAVASRPDSRRLRAALETLGALGPHCPDLASRHAPGVASAVLDRLLPRAPHEVSGSGRGAARDGTGRAGTWADPSPGVVLKAAAMKALTRMLLPDPSPAEGGVGGGVDAGLPEWPALLSVLASRVVPALESLSDPLSETGPAGEVGNGEAARLRLAAFTCLFRIVRRADARAPQAAYVAMALCVQDTDEEVRAAVLAALSRHLASLTQLAAVAPAFAVPAARFAAAAALAAWDPQPEHRARASRAVSDFVAARRRAAHAQAGAGGAMAPHAAPEMALVFSVALLAHHPDLPDIDERDLAGTLPAAAELAPFQAMLAALLVPLLSAAEGVPPAGSLPLVVQTLRTVKHTEDALSQRGGPGDATPAVRLMADVGLLVARGAAVALAGEAAVAQAGRFPGTVSVPRSLFRPLPSPEEVFRDYSHLPKGTTVAEEVREAAAAVGEGRGRRRAPRASGRAGGKTHRRKRDARQPGEGRGAGRGGRARARGRGVDSEDSEGSEGESLATGDDEDELRAGADEAEAGGEAAQGSAGEAGPSPGSSPAPPKRAKSVRQPLAATNGREMVGVTVVAKRKTRAAAG